MYGRRVRSMGDRAGATEESMGTGDTAAKPLSNRERERIAEAALDMKLRVFEATRQEFDLEGELSGLQREFGEQIRELEALLRETVETAHDGKPESKAAIYDRIVTAWQDRDEKEAEKKSTLAPILEDLKAARKRRAEALANVNQLPLPL